VSRCAGQGLRATEASLEWDQLLERAALFEIGVVKAVGRDVGDGLEFVRSPQVSRRAGGEELQRVLALDPTVDQVLTAADPTAIGPCQMLSTRKATLATSAGIRDRDVSPIGVLNIASSRVRNLRPPISPILDDAAPRTP
jgi:hypothetical protein